MKKFKIVIIEKVRIIYKSGYVHEFECLSFNFKHGSLSYESATSNSMPYMIGGEHIESIWKVGSRRSFKYE